MRNFDISGKQLVLDGKPIRLLSGAIHYFRVMPEYWEDRLRKLQACGFNTVETYVPWNLHEPEEGTFCFEGIADLERFVSLAGELGLHVIVRPSPYICAEWEFGGMPAWLLAEDNMQLRCMDRTFLDKVDAYFDVLLPRLKPLLSTNGGPIIAMQIENEYGSYGNDRQYLVYLQQAMIRRGIDVLLFTSDGPTDAMLQGGTVPGVWATVNFGSRAREAFDKLLEYRPDQPLMCMEFWNGWFDHWREQHHTRDAQDAAQAFREIMECGASVNFYMFHGGTNFGYFNGANYGEFYEPTVTSYDYDCLLNEYGKPTDKFFAVQKVLRSFVSEEEQEAWPELPPELPAVAYGQVKLTEQAVLFDQLDQLSAAHQSQYPVPMEKLGQDYGFILYSCQVTGPRPLEKLTIQDVRDRAIVYMDGKYIGTIERWNAQPLEVEVGPQGARLDIFVENMGRVNYGPLLKDHKGITEGVRLNNQFLFDWTIRPLPLADISQVRFDGNAAEEPKEMNAAGPVFYKGTFQAEQTADTFIRLDGWVKGNVYINGFHLGRYWEAGPQKTLYIPAPLLRAGVNEIVVLELHGTKAPVVALEDQPEL